MCYTLGLRVDFRLLLICHKSSLGEWTLIGDHILNSR